MLELPLSGGFVTESENRRKRWYIDRGINPAYIGVLATFLVGVLAWARGVDKGQSSQDEKILAVEKQVTDVDKRTREDMKEIREGIQKILEQEHAERMRR